MMREFDEKRGSFQKYCGVPGVVGRRLLGPGNPAHLLKDPLKN